MPEETFASARRQWQVRVTGIDGLWASLSGGDVNAGTTMVWDGGADFADPIAGAPEAGDVTVMRPFHRVQDTELIREALERVGDWRTTVTKQPTNSQGVPLGTPRTYANALLKGVIEPDYEAAASDQNRWGLVFAVGQYH